LAAAVVVLLIVILVTPPGRQAIARLAEIAGITIEFKQVPEVVTPPARVVGEIVTLAEAQEALEIALRLPEAMDEPDSIQLTSWGGGRQVAMVWNADENLPEILDTGTGLVLVQFAAAVEQELLLKNATAATRLERVEVNGSDGFFLSGAPHVVFFKDADGLIIEDTIRLAGNVLVWEVDGITYRIESALSLAAVLDLAESLRTAAP
jgi:hypothetical protein